MMMKMKITGCLRRRQWTTVGNDDDSDSICVTISVSDSRSVYLLPQALWVGHFNNPRGTGYGMDSGIQICAIHVDAATSATY